MARIARIALYLRKQLVRQPLVISGSGGGGGVQSLLLLADGASYLLLANGSDRLVLAGPPF